MSLERDTRARDLSNWLAVVINSLQEQYRRPNYTELLILIDKIDTQLPKVRHNLIYLKNTSEESK